MRFSNKNMNVIIKMIFPISAMLVPVYAISDVALTAEDTVRESTQVVLQRLDMEQSKLKLHPEYIQTIVNDLVIPHFDFSTMSRLVLDKHWQALNNSEKDCFCAGFRNLLVVRYADIFLSYTKQQITYRSEHAIGEKNYVSVRQIVSHDGIGPFHVDYHMRPDADGWKVVDLVVDEVSLLKSYRETFKRNIQQQGLQNFILDFQECNL